MPVQSTAALIDEALSVRRMLDHPFYRAWEAGELSQRTLADYAQQYFHHVEVFPQAVSAAHAVCPDQRGRRMLAENLAEEEGVGQGRDPHAKLWLAFAAGMGADEASVRSAQIRPETQALIDAFTRLSRQSYPSALGALYAYESQMPDVAATKIKGLVARYGVTQPAVTEFFSVHARADVEHAEVCRALLNKLSTAEAEEARTASVELAEALLGFLDGVERQRC